MKGATTGRFANGAVTRIVDLAQPLHSAIPSSSSHPGYKHALMRRHGDVVRVDGTSGANDLLVLGTHTGTHVDALSHISHAGKLHGGIEAVTAQRSGSFASHGVEEISPTVCPGVLLDIPKLFGRARIPAGEPVTRDHLDACAALLGAPIPKSAALLVRTGWGQLWDAPQDFISHDAGVPGPDEDATHWLSAHAPLFVGSDTTAFEHIPAGEGHARLPGHKHLLVDKGIPIIEMLNLESLSAARALMFTFVLTPLPLRGATGSPVRPIALLDS